MPWIPLPSSQSSFFACYFVGLELTRATTRDHTKAIGTGPYVLESILAAALSPTIQA